MNINNLKNFVAVYVSDLKSLHKMAKELINKGHSVYCLFKDSYLKDLTFKPAYVYYFNSHFGTYVLVEIEENFIKGK